MYMLCINTHAEGQTQQIRLVEASWVKPKSIRPSWDRLRPATPSCAELNPEQSSKAQLTSCQVLPDPATLTLGLPISRLHAMPSHAQTQSRKGLQNPVEGCVAIQTHVGSTWGFLCSNTVSGYCIGDHFSWFLWNISMCFCVLLGEFSLSFIECHSIIDARMEVVPQVRPTV